MGGVMRRWCLSSRASSLFYHLSKAIPVLSFSTYVYISYRRLSPTITNSLQVFPQSLTMPSISDQRKQDLDVKIQREEDIRQKLDEQRQKMEDIMDRMDQAARDQMSSSADAARTKRGKESVMSSLEAELEAQRLAVERLEEHYREAREEREQWETWSKGKDDA